MYVKFYAEILHPPLAEGRLKGVVSPSFNKATTPPSGQCCQFKALPAKDHSFAVPLLPRPVKEWSFTGGVEFLKLTALLSEHSFACEGELSSILTALIFMLFSF